MRVYLFPQLKICLTILVAASLEVERGVDSLWKHGKSNGMKDYPNYGQFIPKNYFKAFLHGFPYLWADEKYWSVAHNDLPWDIITPFVSDYNKQRGKILRVVYLMLDESTSG